MPAQASSQLHEDLRMAAEFQRAVLPDQPQLSYLTSSVLYYPCGHVSGDVYNFQLNREGELTVFLGDATGHGVTAALMTMLVHLSLEHFPGNLPTDEILRRLNSMVARHNTGLSIASQLFRISSSGKLYVTHAGQPSLIVFPRQTDATVIFEKGGCPLGMFDDEKVPYTQEHFQLQDGDRILAFTDGLTDWKNQQGEAFGMERLQQTMKAFWTSGITELSDYLFSVIQQFAGQVPNHDDVTVLGFEYRQMN